MSKNNTYMINKKLADSWLIKFDEQFGDLNYNDEIIIGCKGSDEKCYTIKRIHSMGTLDEVWLKFSIILRRQNIKHLDPMRLPR